MITLEKLRIFAIYKGDADMFGRIGRKVEKAIISEADWHLIDTLLQDCIVLDRNLGAEQRNIQASQRIKEHCENDEVVSRIRYLAERL